MQCDICHRPASGRLDIYCTFCARDALYLPRIRLAQSLLHNESLKGEVERNVGSSSKLGQGTNTDNPKSSNSNINPSWILQSAAGEQTFSEERIDSILSHAKHLRSEIQRTKDDIAARKARFQRRRSEFTSGKQELLQSQAKGIEPFEKSIQRTQHRWAMMHEKTAEARVFLCREAALLYGLQQRKRRKGGLGRDIYLIGGVPIPDLRDMNNASPTQVTASATNLAQLVHLVSHYLSLRLPAEITLPHHDYPFPTIFSPSSSYTGREVPFPGSTPSQSSSNSPSSSRHTEQRPLPRPRPLHIDKKLSALDKEDKILYASFVEGITFLAWDVAWLCKTQGIDVGHSSWEEVCAIGKNLWQLLLASLTRPPLPRETSNRTPQKPAMVQKPSTGAGIPTVEDLKSSPPQGYFSHGTAYGFLAAAEGNDHMRDWRLQSPIKVVEKVKQMLLAERTGAEWEILEGNEWEVEENEADAKREVDLVNRFPVEDTGVLVRPEAKVHHREERAGMTNREEGEEKGKNTSGWMKLKNR